MSIKKLRKMYGSNPKKPFQNPIFSIPNRKECLKFSTPNGKIDNPKCKIVLSLLVKRAESALRLSLQQIQEIAKDTDWRRPGHCSTARSAGWRQRLFHEKLFSGSWKGTATDCEAMLTLLGVITAAFCNENQLRKERESFAVLLEIRTPVN